MPSPTPRQAAEKISHYEVTNRRTGVVKTYATSLAASRAVDRMDNAYGGYVATRKAVWVAA